MHWRSILPSASSGMVDALVGVWLKLSSSPPARPPHQASWVRPLWELTHRRELFLECLNASRTLQVLVEKLSVN